MIVTVLYNYDDNLDVKTFKDISDAETWIEDKSFDNDYKNFQILVDYANVEFYKNEFHKYQDIILNQLGKLKNTVKNII